jgi:hypothetical protein
VRGNDIIALTRGRLVGRSGRYTDSTSMKLRLRMFVSTVLLISAMIALGAPLLLLAMPYFGKSQVVDEIAFVSLIGLFPLLTVASLIAALTQFLRARTRQGAIEIVLACLLLVVAAFNGAP